MEEEKSVRELVFLLEDRVTEAAAEADKFERGNNSAGTRLRKSMQDIKKMAQDIRLAVSLAKIKRKE